MKTFIKSILFVLVASVLFSCNVDYSKKYVVEEGPATEFIRKAFTEELIDQYKESVEEKYNDETLRKIEMFKNIIDDNDFTFSLVDGYGDYLNYPQIDAFFYLKDLTGEDYSEDEISMILKSFYVGSGASDFKVEKVGKKTFKCYGGSEIGDFLFEVKKLGKDYDGEEQYELEVVSKVV